ncbi:MAG TPA: hypothetical protein VFS20_14605, partial [Longimicrobium sp.]|nr:hypothetical protein [Longimicrobium sp.]
PHRRAPSPAGYLILFTMEITMPWNYVATFTGTGQIHSPVAAAVDSPAAYGTLRVLWGGGSGGGPLTSFQYELPPFLSAPAQPVPVTPAPVGNVSSTNQPAVLFADGQFFAFWRGAVTDTSIYCSPLDKPDPATTLVAAPSGTQDAPMVVALGTDQVFLVYNGPDASMEFWSGILGGLGSTPTFSTQPGLVASGAAGYFSPAVSATPDGGVSLFYAGLQGDDHLYYTSATQPANSNFIPISSPDVTTTSKPALGTWVPSPEDVGAPTLVAVYPTSNGLYYMEAPYSEVGVTWATPRPVPMEIIPGNAAGQLVTLSNPVVAWATSPVFSDTLFLLIVDLAASNTMYLVRYTGPVRVS